MEINTISVGDALAFLRELPDNSIDLIFSSPPYGKARRYKDAPDSQLPAGEDWVRWMVPIILESIRVCRGLVAYVVDGNTKNFDYDCAPILLMADLKRAWNRFDQHRKPKFVIRKPPIFGRVGIMGSGGPDWWRSDYELVLCFSKGKLPWSCNTYGGKPPKYPAGGAPSHRNHKGEKVKKKDYVPPAIANPGNVMWGSVGKGHMGSDLAHENEAPFPEWLATRYVGSFCPPISGVTCDPFCGSGTTLAVAKRLGRNFIGNDFRESQRQLSLRRLATVTPDLYAPKDVPTCSTQPE